MDINQYDTLEYVKVQGISTLLSVVWYGVTLFRPLGTCSLSRSLQIFLGLVIIGTTTGAIFDWHDREYCTVYNIARNIVIPLGLYTSMAYYAFESLLINWGMGIILIVCIGYSIYSVAVFWGNKNEQKNFSAELYRLCQVVLRLSSIGLAIEVVFIAVKAISIGYGPIGIISVCMNNR